MILLLLLLHATSLLANLHNTSRFFPSPNCDDCLPTVPTSPASPRLCPGRTRITEMTYSEALRFYNENSHAYAMNSSGPTSTLIYYPSYVDETCIRLVCNYASLISPTAYLPDRCGEVSRYDYTTPGGLIDNRCQLALGQNTLDPYHVELQVYRFLHDSDGTCSDFDLYDDRSVYQVAVTISALGRQYALISNICRLFLDSMQYILPKHVSHSFDQEHSTLRFTYSNPVPSTHVCPPLKFYPTLQDAILHHPFVIRHPSYSLHHYTRKLLPVTLPGYDVFFGREFVIPECQLQKVRPSVHYVPFPNRTLLLQGWSHRQNQLVIRVHHHQSLDNDFSLTNKDNIGICKATSAVKLTQSLRAHSMQSLHQLIADEYSTFDSVLSSIEKSFVRIFSRFFTVMSEFTAALFYQMLRLILAGFSYLEPAYFKFILLIRNYDIDSLLILAATFYLITRDRTTTLIVILLALSLRSMLFPGVSAADNQTLCAPVWPLMHTNESVSSFHSVHCASCINSTVGFVYSVGSKFCISDGDYQCALFSQTHNLDRCRRRGHKTLLLSNPSLNKSVCASICYMPWLFCPMPEYRLVIFKTVHTLTAELNSTSRPRYARNLPPIPAYDLPYIAILVGLALFLTLLLILCVLCCICCRRTSYLPIS